MPTIRIDTARQLGLSQPEGFRTSSKLILAVCATVVGVGLWQEFVALSTDQSRVVTSTQQLSRLPASRSAETSLAADLPRVAPDSLVTTKLTPIEQLEVGDRVRADSPTDDVDRQFGSEIVLADWRKLTLSAPKRDGTTADIVLLRPLSWLQQQNAAVGGTVFISVPECGIDGHAGVLAIDECPEIIRGDGEVITGTFRHQAPGYVSLCIAAERDPILCTGNHPFWSEDRQDFVRADSLKPGDDLRTATGTTTVQSLTAIAKATPVHNLEVFGAHVYHVGVCGVLVHNSTPPSLPIIGGNCFWPKLDGHHPLSKFLGGDPDQLLSCIPRPYHRELHSELASLLKSNGFPNVGGVGGSAADWARYFAANPGSQDKAFELLFDVTRGIDAKYGTNIVSDLWKNIVEGNFRNIP